MNHPLLNIAVLAARQAGKIIVRSLDHLEAGDISEKQKHDFVTRVDMASEQHIIQAIRDAYPDHAILAEESGDQPTGSETQWIIDPLDGTMNFIHGIPHFAISIGIKHRGVLEAGMVFDPVKNELFTAVKGKGALLNNRKIRVSNCKSLEYALLATGFPFRDDQPLEKYMKTFTEIMPKAAGIRRPGAASLDLAYTAAGRFDGYWELGLQPWDLAAGVLLVKEAGGLVTELNGSEDYFRTGNVLAGNLDMHKILLNITR